MDYSFLDHFPTYVFSELISKWSKSPLELQPNGVLSEENKETTITFLKELSASRMKQLVRLADTLKLTDTWWQAYQFTEPKPLSEIRLRPKTIDIGKYLPDISSKINASFSLIDLCEHAILLNVEISSRTRSLRDSFRYILLPSIHKVLMEKKSISYDLLEKELIPFLSSAPEKVKSKPVRARLVKQLAVSPDDPQHRVAISSLKIRISLETSGIEGLQHIIIEGDNVIRGVETLEQRHEISLQFMQSGPWIGVGTKEFQLEIGKGIKLHQLEADAFKRLNTVLNWY